MDFKAPFNSSRDPSCSWGEFGYRCDNCWEFFPLAGRNWIHESSFKLGWYALHATQFLCSMDCYNRKYNPNSCRAPGCTETDVFGDDMLKYCKRHTDCDTELIDLTQ